MAALLKFFKANAKLKKLEKLVKGKVWTFSELSGHTCPFAKDCHSKVIVTDGKRSVQDGKDTKFRCFSASQEALFPNVYKTRKYNTDMVKSCTTVEKLRDMIVDSLPQKARVIRIHVGGDFSLQRHFDAWIEVAKMKPEILFYAYTKALPFWVKRLNSIPDNLIMTASRGGKRDDLIDAYKLREAVVVFSEQEAIDKGLEIDHDDSHAALPELKHQSFALLIHNTQPKGSLAAASKHKLNGKGSYGRKSNE